MRFPVFIGSSFVAKYPEGGGNFWVPLQYLLGLRALGHDAWWVEILTSGDAATGRRAIEVFRRHVEALGVADRVVLGHVTDGTRNDRPGCVEWIGLPEAELDARARDGVLLNFANSLTTPFRARFARTVLVDLDPGPFQLWAREEDMGVGSHDALVTIGQNLGAPDSRVPLGGVAWGRIWPAVHLPAWPAQPPPPGGRYTTVTQWWTRQWAVLDGEIYDCNKRPSFLAVLTLPARVPVALELAVNLHPDESDDRRLLACHGWHVVDPNVVAGTPQAFRAYVQGSRGEFSAAKPAYVKARPGWVSDRTICYLASGRPCVVEATGAERHLPPSAGLRFFTTLEEAAEAIVAIERDYPAACRAARALAEEVFATDVVVPALLRAACAP